VRDKIALVSAALGVSAILAAVQWGIYRAALDPEWFLMIGFTAFLFGTSGYTCFSWLREKRLRRTWPVAVTFFALLSLHCGVVGGIIWFFHPDWRGPHWLVVLFLEIPIMAVALEFAHQYAMAPKGTSLLDFIRSLRDHHELS
jgi:hypothetical protein